MEEESVTWNKGALVVELAVACGGVAHGQWFQASVGRKTATSLFPLFFLLSLLRS
jgi:hypothetical protein